MSHYPAQNDTANMVQLLTPEGKRVDDDRFSWQGSDADLRKYFRDMVLARRFDTEANALQRHGELGLWPPLLGQEAAQVGSAHALGSNDVAFPSYREHAVALTLGAPISDLLGLFRGSHPGDWHSLPRFQNYAIVIGAQTLHATGYAMGMQLDGLVGQDDQTQNSAVIVYHGDGASSQGDVNEAYIFAASYSAPVVFFCQNNQWAISEPTTRQTKIPLYQRANGFGFPGVRVDGNDVLAVKTVTDWALDRARRGQGPSLIEAFTYRMGAHTTSDDPTKYRFAAEDEYWRLRDPIERVKTYLVHNDQISAEELTALANEADDFGGEIRRLVKELPNRTMAEQFASVYAEQTPYLAAQHQQFVEYQGSLEVLS